LIGFNVKMTPALVELSLLIGGARNARGSSSTVTGSSQQKLFPDTLGFYPVSELSALVKNDDPLRVQTEAVWLAQ